MLSGLNAGNQECVDEILERRVAASMLSGLNAGNQDGQGCGSAREDSPASMLSGLNAGNQAR